jgi:single-strand DNA-binding protein
MNNLNSILLEGKLIENPVLANREDGQPQCNFTVQCYRMVKNAEDELVEEKHLFDVVVLGRLAEICKEYLSKDRGVRVVGRLQQTKRMFGTLELPYVSIFGEHVEFRPNPAKA